MSSVEASQHIPMNLSPLWRHLNKKTILTKKTKSSVQAKEYKPSVQAVQTFFKLKTIHQNEFTQKAFF
jgi:hypothetical protein